MLFYPLFVHDKGFSVSDRCTHCMACIGGCPAEAIEYKAKSKNCRRHYIMNDSLCYKNGGN